MATALRAVLFDLDGTLIDSAPDIRAALNVALEEAGRPPLDLDAVKGMVGGGARRLIERALDGAPASAVEAAHARFLDYYRAHPAARTVLYPDARFVLEDLDARGIALAIATNKPHDITVAILARLGIATHFRAVVGSMAGMALKPAPDILLSALGKLDVAREHAIMVGDSGADAGAAEAAGIRAVLLSHGYAHEPLTTLGAMAVVSGFKALGDVLKTLRS